MADLVTQYFNELQGLKGLSRISTDSRRHELVCVLRHCKRPVDEITTKDIVQTVASVRRAGYAMNTQRMYLSTFKRFVFWLIKHGFDIDPETVKEIKIPAMNYDTKRPDDLLTVDEVETVIRACTTARDRAMIAMLYDGSHRPVEIRKMKWGDLFFDAFGVKVVTKEKTGKERKIRHVYSLPYLEAWRQEWIAFAGRDPRPGDPVFVSHHKPHGPISHQTIMRVCMDLRERTGIKKVHPAVFRPSKITADIESGADHTYLMMKNWGHLNTRMLQVYAKPSDEFMDRVALERAGIKQVKERITRTLKPAICEECQTLNPTGAEYCTKCGAGLTDEARGWIARLEKMMADPARLRAMADRIEQEDKRN